VADLVSLDEIRAAATRLRGVTVRTPLLAFPGAAGASGPPALLIKPESLQPTGAFKLRGAYNAIATLLADADAAGGADTRPAGVVAHSSGNHGFAVAYAAALLGVPAAIVVPDTAPPVKTDLIKSVGAELVVVAPTLAARLEASAKIANDRGYAEIPPFDDRRVIAGQGTVGLEIAEDFAAASDGAGRPAADRDDSLPTAARGAARPAAVLVPVGGGGLISGIAVAVKALLPGTRVIGVEPEFAADARESLRSGARVAWAAADTVRTKADSLRVEQVGELTFPHIEALVDDIVTVSEAEMLEAVRRLALQGRLVAEPGGAVAVAAALFRDPAELQDQEVWRFRHGDDGNAILSVRAEVASIPPGSHAPLVAVLSGGNIDPTLLTEILGGPSYTG
jgi:threo-3-hydroxy-L-aspartate ammonia-lyase